MTVYRVFKEKDAVIEQISKEEALSKLEAHWNNAEQMLAEGATLWTPFAYYATSYQKLQEVTGTKEAA